MRRALLIGAQTHGLQGCHADVELMRDFLTGHDWDDVRVLTDVDATRESVLIALADLATAAKPQDAVLLYFSGHGGRTPRRDFKARRDAGLEPYYKFIVTTGPGPEFAGVLAEELALAQQRLTAVTPNVTTILDCCFAGYMARSAALRPKAVTGAFPLGGIDAILARLPVAHGAAGSDTNPDVVRAVACAPEQSAYELADDDGVVHGVFTAALVAVLRTLDARRVSWSTVGELVRRRVIDRVAEQRPDIEGPSDRILFSTQTTRRRASLPVVVRHERALLEAPQLFGIGAGDVFALETDAGEPLGRATVTALEGDGALLDATAALPADTRAVALTLTAPPRRVELRLPSASASAVAALIAEAPGLTVGSPAFASVDEGLVVRDQAGARIAVNSEPDDDAGRRRAVELLRRLAAAQRMRDLASGEGDAAFDARVELTLNAAGRACAPYGERLAAGTHVSVRLRNLSARPVFAWLFDIGVSARTSLVTLSRPSGIRLGRRGALDDTHVVWGDGGTPLAWPGDVPADGERLETFLAIIADREQNLGALTTRDARSPRSPLDTPALRYRVERLDFFLSP